LTISLVRYPLLYSEIFLWTIIW